VLPCGIDGVHAKEITPISGVESINRYDAPCVGLLDVAAHLMASTLTRQLFKLPASVHVRAVCIQPSQGPT
jgi:hypothetical protein